MLEIAWIAPGLTLLAGVVWAVRLEGRINSHDSLFTERAHQESERHTELKERLVRIEHKLDKMCPIERTH